MEKFIKTTKSHGFSQSIPHDIALDTLPRLPFKSLQRFKSVCKAWCYLISTPQFLEENFALANARNNVSLWKCIYIASRGETDGSDPVCLETLDSNGSTRELTLSRPIVTNSLEGLKILSSCNGLLLLCCSYNLFIWNPCSGKKKYVPARPHSLRAPFAICGLGYDSSSDDYKAVFGVHDDNYCKIYILHYTFSTNTWKKIYAKDFPYDSRSEHQGATVNGAPHWVLVRKALNELIDTVLVYFDPAEEMFRELSSPVYISVFSKFVLGVLGGCLSLTHNPRGSHFETWVMREYGVKESWTKLFVFPSSYEYLRPLCFTMNNEVIMEEERNRLVVYNIRGNTEIHVSSAIDRKYCCKDLGNSGFQLGTYVESLAFPRRLWKIKKSFSG